MSDQTPIEHDSNDHITRRTKTAFVQIVLIEIAILFALWFVGRIFS